MAAKKIDAGPKAGGITAADERANANATGARPGRGPVTIEQPPVTAEPIEIRPTPPPAQVATTDGFPKIKRVVFKDKINFVHSTIGTTEINLEYAEAAKVWKSVEFCNYFGALALRLERVNPTSGERRVYRMPFAECALVETWEDNPVASKARISVNEHVVEVPQ